MSLDFASYDTLQKMEFGKLKVVVGLPGAGKSTKVCEIRPYITGLAIEDFHKDAIGNSTAVTQSRHCKALIEALRAGHTCVIADVAFCDKHRRISLTSVLTRELPGLEVEWLYFENNPQKCAANIRYRNRNSIAEDLRTLSSFASKYAIPEGVQTIAIWQSADASSVDMLQESENPEAGPLQLLSDLQPELQGALDSLGGRTSSTICDHYHLYASGYIHRAAEGYLVLRNAGRVDASKLLIRPAIEAMIRLQALRKQPELLYRIAYSEVLEDRKWFRPAANALGEAYDEHADPPSWSEFEARFREAFPNAQSKREKLSLFDAAQIAGLEKYYNTHYRMYSQYTHAALRAAGGYTNELSDPEDTRTIIVCAFAALDAVVAIGADSPYFERLRARVDELAKQPPERFGRKIVG